MNGDFELEALETYTPDGADSTGRRCEASHPDVGICHRRFDHTQHDPWHLSVTGASDVSALTGQFWRWRERP